MVNWEKYAPGVRRLPVAGGWIYDVGLHAPVFVPFPPKKSSDTNT